MNKFLLLAAIATSSLQWGCSSISTLHDAGTTPKASWSYAFAAGNISGNVTADGLTGLKGDIGKKESLPMVEFMARYGVAENWDIGIRTSGFSHGADTKYNFYKTNTLALSVGVGLTSLRYEVSTSGSTATEEFSTIDLSIPIYFSYYMSGSTTLYFVPKIINRNANGSTTSSSDSFTGASLGTKIGKDSGFIAEYTMLSGKTDISQFALGYYWN